RLSTGMQYRQSGSEYKSGEDFGEGGSYSFETRESLGYLNIPAEVRYEFGAGKIKPFMRGGGTLGLLLSAKSKNTTNFNGRKNESETDIKNQKKSINLALSFGGGASFPLGKYRGLVSVRYLIGLTNIVKNEEAPGARTNDLTYSVGLGIPIF
ncbi:MAG: outer membrane beta-barrel protein, partial [bacterium]